MKRLILLIITCLLQLSFGDWEPAPKSLKLEFPRDHGSHPAQKIEWWYFTGNLAADDGHEFGYQLTFFRIGVDPNPRPVNPSAWTVRDLHMTHFAISDLTDGKYECAKRLNRAGPGLSGADLGSLKTWNGTWSASMSEEGTIKLEAESDKLGLSLQMKSGKGFAAHGENGYSRKGATEGNASIYYSFTRLETSGSLRMDKDVHSVKGLSWMDHEFGTSFLELGQSGWDWFSLQLSDGSELMLFQLRTLLPGAKPMMSGSVIDKQGNVVSLKSDDFQLTPGKVWNSSVTGAKYPVEWQIAVPSQQIKLKLSTPLETQEMRSEKAGPSYWEGAVRAVGTKAGENVTAKGYLEMTGYSGASMRSFFAGPE